MLPTLIFSKQNILSIQCTVKKYTTSLPAKEKETWIIKSYAHVIQNIEFHSKCTIYIINNLRSPTQDVFPEHNRLSQMTNKITHLSCGEFISASNYCLGLGLGPELLLGLGLVV